MNELVVIAEGETELAFVRDLLAAHLAVFGISAWAVLPGRHRNKGGVKKWEIARQDIIRTLKENRYCTTMIDYYAMPMDWPGRQNATAKHWRERARFVETELAKAVQGEIGDSFNPQYFIPYVQLHEFEALAFSDVTQLAAVVAQLSEFTEEKILKQLQTVLDEAGEPEAINDGYDTCPSRRIQAIAKPYKKRIHGPITIARIGLGTIRQKCGHFDLWLKKLEQLAPPNQEE